MRKKRAHSAPRWENGYLVKARKRPGKGRQETVFNQPMERVSCEEFGCEWFLLGEEGVDAGFPFVHPQGVECGDFSRCLPCASPIVEGRKKRLCGACLPCKTGTANCPCAARRHWLPDETKDLKFVVATDTEVKRVGDDEWHQKTGEGLYTLNHINTRGL